MPRRFEGIQTIRPAGYVQPHSYDRVRGEQTEHFLRRGKMQVRTLVRGGEGRAVTVIRARHNREVLTRPTSSSEKMPRIRPNAGNLDTAPRLWRDLLTEFSTKMLHRRRPEVPAKSLMISRTCLPFQKRPQLSSEVNVRLSMRSM